MNEYRILYGDLKDDMGSSFQNSRMKGDRLFEILKDQISFDSIKTACDIGCHMGAMRLPFSNLGMRIFGVDYDEDLLSFGRQETGIEGLYKGGVERLIEKGI